MGGPRRTREEILERQVSVATAVFAVAFTAASRALRPYAVELPEAFARADSGNFPFTPQHVSVAHLVACIAFVATLLQSLSTWSFSTHPMKSQVALLVSLVNGVSATLYLAKCLGSVTIVASGAPGEHMMPLRYLQWLFTTGCLIRTLACLSPDGPGAARVLRRTLCWDAVMLASGCVERLLPSPVNGVAFAASTLGFLQTMRGQYALFALGEKTLSTRGDLVALKALRRMTTLTWCAFPLGRAACWAGVLGTNGEEVVFSVLDVLAKFGYSTFLMVGTFALAAKGAE